MRSARTARSIFIGVTSSGRALRSPCHIHRFGSSRSLRPPKSQARSPSRGKQVTSTDPRPQVLHGRQAADRRANHRDRTSRKYFFLEVVRVTRRARLLSHESSRMHGAPTQQRLARALLWVDDTDSTVQATGASTGHWGRPTPPQRRSRNDPSPGSPGRGADDRVARCLDNGSPDEARPGPAENDGAEIRRQDGPEGRRYDQGREWQRGHTGGRNKAFHSKLGKGREGPAETGRPDHRRIRGERRPEGRNFRSNQGIGASRPKEDRT